MKKLFYSFIALVALCSCGYESADERICRQAQEFTKASCPKPMDEYTVLDSLVYTPKDKVMSYYYTVSDLMDTDSVYTSAMLDIFNTDLLNNVRQNIGLHELREHCVTFRYVYSSKTTHKQYMTFEYASKDYK